MKIKYTDGDTLCHFNDYHIPKGQAGAGRFGHDPRKPRYSNETGVGYINKYEYAVQGPPRQGDGDRVTYYTSAGQKRKEYEESVNKAKKSKNRLDEDALYDTSRWVREDIQGYQDAADALAKGAKATNNIIDMFNNVIY